MREAQRVHGVDEEVRPPRAGRIRRTTTPAPDGRDNSSGRGRSDVPARWRSTPETALHPVRCDRAAVPAAASRSGTAWRIAETARSLPPPAGPRSTTPASRSTRRESSRRREPPPSCPAQTAGRSTRDRGEHDARACGVTYSRRMWAETTPIFGCASRKATCSVEPCRSARCRRCRRSRCIARVPAREPRSGRPRVRRSSPGEWILIRGIGTAREHVGRLVGRAVVNDDQFPVGECLCEHAVDRLLQPGSLVIGRHHGRHGWCGAGVPGAWKALCWTPPVARAPGRRARACPLTSSYHRLNCSRRTLVLNVSPTRIRAAFPIAMRNAR